MPWALYVTCQPFLLPFLHHNLSFCSNIPAQASAITDWGMLWLGMRFSPSPITMDDVIYATKVGYLAVSIWGLTMVTVKTSICLTLLRIPQPRHFVVALYVVMTCQILYFVLNTMYLFSKCRPLSAAWTGTTNGGSCVDISNDVLVSNAGSGINIATDIFLSLAPMFIFWNLRRPLRERVLVCVLTGLGLLASLASIRKVTIMLKWGRPDVQGDIWELSTAINTMTILEQFLAVLAACSPSLKGPIQRGLAKWGVLLTRYDNNISFITLPRRSHHGPHGSIYERQADAEVGSYPGLITGASERNQSSDDPSSEQTKPVLTSPSRSTIPESIHTAPSRGEVSQSIHEPDK